MAVVTRRYTFDELLDSPENKPRTELVEGVLVERMPTSWDHGQVVKALWRWLDPVEQSGSGVVALGPVAVVLDARGARRNVREPDVCFIRRERTHIITSRAIEGVPDLAIEVLSPRNRNDDLPGGPVWNDYERFGVPNYWIVDTEARTVAQYTWEGGHYGPPVELGQDDVLASPLFPGITLPVRQLFAALHEV